MSAGGRPTDPLEATTLVHLYDQRRTRARARDQRLSADDGLA